MKSDGKPEKIAPTITGGSFASTITFLIFVHPLKVEPDRMIAPLPMDVTESGIVMDVRPEQPQKA